MSEQQATQGVGGDVEAFEGWGDIPEQERTRKKKKKEQDKELALQITSLLDALFIILCFLLKSYSTSPVSITQSNKLQLPKSSAILDPKDSLPLVVDKLGITVDGEPVLALKDGKIPEDKVDGHIIGDLVERLREKAEEKRKMAEMNSDLSFKGELIVVCDGDLPFAILRDILITAGDAEYGQFRFAVVKAAS